MTAKLPQHLNWNSSRTAPTTNEVCVVRVLVVTDKGSDIRITLGQFDQSGEFWYGPSENNEYDVREWIYAKDLPLPI